MQKLSERTVKMKKTLETRPGTSRTKNWEDIAKSAKKSNRKPASQSWLKNKTPTKQNAGQIHETYNHEKTKCPLALTFFFAFVICIFLGHCVYAPVFYHFGFAFFSALHGAFFQGCKFSKMSSQGAGHIWRQLWTQIGYCSWFFLDPSNTSGSKPWPPPVNLFGFDDFRFPFEISKVQQVYWPFPLLCSSAPCPLNHDST